MQVSIETVSGLERRMTVGVPADQVENEVTARLQKAAKTVRLDGFRAGKVPFKVVRQRFGSGVRQEVVGEVVSKSFQDAISKENVRPAGQPSIDSLTDEPGKDLEFVASFEVYPEVELQDFASLSVVKPVAEVTEADVDKMIDVLRNQNATWHDVERAAADGDQVKIDYTGRKDGEEFEGGKATGSNLVLGSGQMIPGFEAGIVGMKAGDTKTINATFPEDYHAEDLKGAAVEFEITVHGVQEKQQPELDDEFFARFGVTEGGEEKFRAEVRSNMERELRNAIKNKVKTRLMTQLLDKHEVALPKALVKEEVGALRRQMLSQFGGGQNFDESLLPDELFSAEAERRVALGLLVAKVIEEAGIKADADKVRAQIEEIAATYEEPEEVVRYYYGNQQLLVGVQSAVLEDQVVEHILQSAALEEQACSYEEAVQPDRPATAEGEEEEGAE
ncbi:MAG: trigger factor [Porticoccaceae bacterium]|nr:trigger factor [Porticoccaceae bacterium]